MCVCHSVLGVQPMTSMNNIVQCKKLIQHIAGSIPTIGNSLPGEKQPVLGQNLTCANRFGYFFGCTL